MTNLKIPPPYPKSHNILSGKKAVITAAAGTGIGFATAKRFIEEGAEVLISDFNEKRLVEASKNLEKEFSFVPHTLICDVKDSLQADQLIEESKAKLGKIDILVNNAGLGGYSKVTDLSDEDWLNVIETSLTGTFKVTRSVLKYMEKENSGVIVNNSSVLGWRAQANQSHYSSAKAGVMAFTRSVALEAAKYGVRVNAVAPSIAIHEHLAKTSSKALIDSLVDKEVFGRAAEPWEIANVIIFLASDYASYLTGEIISVSSQHP